MSETPLLSSLRLPEDIPGLSPAQKAELAQELRHTIIRVVTQNVPQRSWLNKKSFVKNTLQNLDFQWE